MVKVNNIKFVNHTGGSVDIYYKPPSGGAFQMITVDAGATSAAINATSLLTIDATTTTRNYSPITYSYDFTTYLPNGVWVEDESPFELQLVLGRDSETMQLRIKDNRGTPIEGDDFNPKGYRSVESALLGGGTVNSLDEARTQLRQCLIASKNRRDIGNTDPNFPDTQRYTITEADAHKLTEFFFSLQSTDGEFKLLYPGTQYRFEVATSLSAGQDVRDFKISPIVSGGNSGSAIFNYHISVKKETRQLRSQPLPRKGSKLAGSAIAADQSRSEQQGLFARARSFFYATPLAFGGPEPTPPAPDSSIATEQGAIQFHLIGQKPSDPKYSSIMQENADILLGMGGLVYDYMHRAYPTVNKGKLDINTWMNVIAYLPDLSFGQTVRKEYKNRIAGVRVSGDFLSMIARAVITDGASLLAEFTAYLNSIGDVTMSASNKQESYQMLTCTYLSYLIEDGLGGYYDYAAIALRQISFHQYFQELKSSCASVDYVNIDMTYDEIITLVNTRRLRTGGADYNNFQNLVNKNSTQKFKDANNFFNGGNTPQAEINPQA